MTGCASFFYPLKDLHIETRSICKESGISTHSCPIISEVGGQKKILGMFSITRQGFIKMKSLNLVCRYVFHYILKIVLYFIFDE